MDGPKQLDEETLQYLYAWIDKIPLSRTKRNISRDFSDGVMAAEVVKYFFPKLVELHNYTPAHSTQQKLSNWSTLNRKVFSKLNFQIPEDLLKKIVDSTAGYIEPVLCSLKEKIEEKRAAKQLDSTQDLEYYSTTNGQLRPGCQDFPQPSPLHGLVLTYTHTHTHTRTNTYGQFGMIKKFKKVKKSLRNCTCFILLIF
ncbi:sperm flagellar protein 1 isoform X2 [Pimephales promelas]|uniref:sperm flagellar protein 1 isoform X2 n=1 Tax=Pimephales promelas TaxID=90988 RepID=UPI001955D172|nr:sperm flagellar protein 1 isoform X2 [Pimephales promelas]